MIKTSGIYKILNCKNNRFYIGSTKNLHKRKQTHFNLLLKNKHPNKFLQNDFNKIGREKFTFIVLEQFESIDPGLQFNSEQKYLDQYFDNQNMCYNLSPTVKSITGYKHTIESKLKMSKFQKGKIISLEQRGKLSISGKKAKNPTKFEKGHIPHNIKTFILLDPQNKEHIITNLSKFCKENRLYWSNLTRNKKRGWRLKSTLNNG